MLELDLAGWRIRLACRPAALETRVAGAYAPFLAPADGAPDAHVDLAWVGDAPRPLPAADLLPAADGDAWRLDAAGMAARIGRDARAATVTFDAAAPAAALEYFLRVLVALLADREGGLLLHAAALRVAGRVHLFTGPSGSGKSTVAALSPAAVTLNDDLVLLRRTGGRWIAHGTPFWNAETLDRGGQTASGPVAGIYRLVQDRDVYLEPLSRAAATAELAANCPVVNGDPAALPGLMVRCRDLAGAVPVARLHFSRDPGFWELIDAGMGRRSR